MVVTIRTFALALSDAARTRIARALAAALAPYRPRAVRATLRLEGARPPKHEALRAQISVPLGPAGVVRVDARAADVASAAREATRLAASAVARQLTAERGALLEFLLLASIAPAAPPPRRAASGHRVRGASRRPSSARSDDTAGRSPRAA